jgi:hypothetical protein
MRWVTPASRAEARRRCDRRALASTPRVNGGSGTLRQLDAAIAALRSIVSIVASADALARLSQEVRLLSSRIARLKGRRRRIPVGSRSVRAGNTWRKKSRDHSCGRTAPASREPPPAIPGQQARSAIGPRIRNAPAAAGLGRGRNPGRGLHHRDDHARSGATAGPRAHREWWPLDRFAAGAIVPDLARADRIANPSNRRAAEARRLSRNVVARQKVQSVAALS